jgi:hypothetical protein
MYRILWETTEKIWSLDGTQFSDEAMGWTTEKSRSDFSLLPSIQSVSEAYPVSCLVSTKVSFPFSKAAGM